MTSMTEGLGDWPSFIGAGAGYVVSRDGGVPNGSLGSWSSEVVFDRTAEIDWPNDSNFFDMNNDGIKDWVIGTGFIPLPDGGITWIPGIENSDGSISFDIPDVIEMPRTEYFYHKAHPADMDNDGDMDFVTTSYKNPEKDWFGNVTEPGIAKLEWFENNGVAGQASFTHHEISENGGALMELHDVDGDGDKDVILPQYFNGASLVWMENPGSANGAWEEHVINDTTGRGFEAIIADMNNDGIEDIVYVNHNHQGATDPSEQVMGVYWFEIPPASTLDGLGNWDATMTTIFEGFYVDETNADQNGAPGVTHVGDVDGDGLMDVSVSGDGDDGLYIFHQQPDQSFSEIMVDTGTAMAGDHHMADLDGDGDMDFLWTIYGSQDIFSGEFEPQSEVNVYLQEVGEVNTNPAYTGTVEFEIQTSFGPDTCTGTVSLNIDGSSVAGSYQCGFGVIGNQNNAITGTIDSNGNITGEIDVTVSFASETYPIPWEGTYSNGQVSCNTSSSAQLGSMAVDYVLDFTAVQ